MSDHEHNNPGNDNDTDRIGLPGGERSEGKGRGHDDPQPGHGNDDERGHRGGDNDTDRIGLPGGE
ncbi:MAG TPA: hypothetical protein VD886_15975 [Herpetosiphonaceae bacterium]|nr:hypothetical protein [Herpetosiphonaceae bacterium]